MSITRATQSSCTWNSLGCTSTCTLYYSIYCQGYTAKLYLEQSWLAQQTADWKLTATFGDQVNQFKVSKQIETRQPRKNTFIHNPSLLTAGNYHNLLCLYFQLPSPTNKIYSWKNPKYHLIKKI